ncbi:hypothetical protein JRC49_11535 [Clostridiales bacterium FE2011]|nr:hypothetical protein JRC49_11535 [Clostridiales bacterium FE2011]
MRKNKQYRSAAGQQGGAPFDKENYETNHLSSAGSSDTYLHLHCLGGKEW